MTRLGRPGLRSVVAAVVGVVCVISIVAAVLAVWAHRVLFDPESIASATESTLAEPEVTEAIGDVVADQLLGVVDVDDALDDQVPPALADLITAGLRSLVADTVSSVVARDDVRHAMGEVAAASHKRLLRVIDRGSLVDGVTADAAGDVRFNLLPVLGRAVERLQDRGLFADLTVPPLRATGDPDEQIAALSDALDRPLPDDFGQIVVFRSEQVGAASVALARAQQAIVLFRSAVLVIFAVVAVTAAVTLGVARRRARAAAFLVGGAVVAMGLARAVVAVVVSDAPKLAVDPGARAAIRTMVSELAAGLVTLVTTIFLVGAVVVVGAWAYSRRRPTSV